MIILSVIALSFIVVGVFLLVSTTARVLKRQKKIVNQVQNFFAGLMSSMHDSNQHVGSHRKIA